MINRNDLDLVKTINWDVIIIGTGFGGAVTGYQLSMTGKNILFIEKGGFSETLNLSHSYLKPFYWNKTINGHINNSFLKFYPSIGCAVGGSSILYGAQMERMFPSDFSLRSNMNIPNEIKSFYNWPIKYDDFLPWYQEAENLFRVRGEHDPLNFDEKSFLLPPPTSNDNFKLLFTWLKSKKLHPYRAHIACEFINDCTGCGGILCKKDCKNDVRKICINPALKYSNTKILDNTEVIRFNANSKSITSVTCIQSKIEFDLTAKIYVLAAGSLSSPRILLNSKSPIWPNGLANSSGLVGKCLMWHVSDYILVKSPTTINQNINQKVLSLNDFYYSSIMGKLGTIQSVGVPINSSYVFKYLDNKFLREFHLFHFLPYKVLLRILSLFIAFYFRKSFLLATIVEDYPNPKNFVSYTSEGSINFNYYYSSDLKKRSRELIDNLLNVLRPKFKCKVLSNKFNLNFGHPSGTCRFGDDPNTSVLNRNNRAHDLTNLYITDASFFPTCGAVNPSLTIAANSLRVAKIITDSFDKGST